MESSGLIYIAGALMMGLGALGAAIGIGNLGGNVYCTWLGRCGSNDFCGYCVLLTICCCVNLELRRQKIEY